MKLVHFIPVTNVNVVWSRWALIQDKWGRVWSNLGALWTHKDRAGSRSSFEAFGVIRWCICVKWVMIRTLQTHSCVWRVSTWTKDPTAFEDQGRNGHKSEAFPVWFEEKRKSLVLSFCNMLSSVVSSPPATVSQTQTLKTQIPPERLSSNARY